MKLNFSKYQGTGNDFIMIDNVNGGHDTLTIRQIQFLCDRKMGIGADGLIKISSHSDFDFEVEYFNSDGTQSFCGNGARCSVSFAKSLGLLDEKTSFMAIDGPHVASINKEGIVRLEMLPVDGIASDRNDYIMDTGSPHFVRAVGNSDETEIVEFGKSIRYSERFKEEGINVNLVKFTGKNEVKVETYERGVEDETLSCGTGVTASALVYMMIDTESKYVDVSTKGGVLKVEATQTKNGFENIWLSGPALKVYDGSIII
ncbi:MAG: diaminopimelate epimerase [Crocinitomicaceae bacterium]|jgi:diaminopimelate epimerase